MDRRTLLTVLFGGGLLGGGGAAALVPRDAAPRPVTEYPTYAHPLLAEGLRLHWSGWKASQETNYLVGQWFAWPEPLTPDPVYYYLNVPGMVGGRYLPGQCFNLMPEGRFVYPETPEEYKDHLIWEGYARLRELLREERA